MPDPFADLERLALSQPSDQLLLLAPREHPLCQRLLTQGGPMPTDALDLLARPPAHRYPLALMAGCLETLPQATGERLIAALRDLYAEEIYCLAAPDLWSAPRMVALGMRPLGVYPQPAKGLALYHFDLYDYKRTPDWLNARHWAHPERWEKTRW